MKLLGRRRYAACLVVGIAWTAMASALSPDTRILSLIPRNTEIVDGSGASPVKAGLMSFLVFRTESAIDLRDFVSLVGADASKTIRQIFLVGGTERPSSRFEHSVISLGRFNRSRIYKAAIQNRARVRAYRGMEILEIDPFSRDQGTIKDQRWLAVIGADLAVFGTMANVREELDRYADHVPADSFLLKRFAQLQRDDETWCLLSKTVQKDGIRRILGLLDRRFLDLARDDTQFQFGIHYGSRIRFDYESAGVSTSDPWTDEEQMTRKQVLASAGIRPFVGVTSTTIEPRHLRGVLTVTRTRYEKWLTELLNAKSGPEDRGTVDHAR